MSKVMPALGLCVIVAGCTFEPALPDVEGIEVDITPDNFSSEVLESSEPVLVDFNATWCGPCRQMEPVLAHLSLNYEGRLKVAKLDVDQNPDLAAEYGISGIPAMVLIENGQEVDRVVGAMSLSELSGWVDQHLPAAAAPAAAESTTEAAGG